MFWIVSMYLHCTSIERSLPHSLLVLYCVTFTRTLRVLIITHHNSQRTIRLYLPLCIVSVFWIKKSLLHIIWNSILWTNSEWDGTSARSRCRPVTHCVCEPRPLPKNARVFARQRNRNALSRLRVRTSQNRRPPPESKVQLFFPLDI